MVDIPFHGKSIAKNDRLCVNLKREKGLSLRRILSIQAVLL